jgi:Flp pilus assembly protein TadD
MAAFKRNAELYPNSANVYNGLADYYEAAGQPELAKQNASKAVDLAARTNSSQLDEFKRHLERLTVGQAAQ